MGNMLWILITAFALLFPSIGSAATVHGTVLEEGSGKPIVGASVTLYKWSKDSKSWHWSDSAQSDENGAFLIEYVDAGTFIVDISSDDWDLDPFESHLEEYYDNIPVWNAAKATRLTIAENDDLALNPIELKLRPYFFEQLTVSPETLPVTGGKLKVTAKVFNNTGKQATLKFWMLTQSWRMSKNDYYELRSDFPLLTETAKVLKPGENTLQFDVNISAKYPNGNWTDLSLWGGQSYESPALPYAMGAFCKGSAADCAQNVAQSRGRELPLRISEDGKVLQWGSRPAKPQ